MLSHQKYISSSITSLRFKLICPINTSHLPLDICEHLKINVPNSELLNFIPKAVFVVVVVATVFFCHSSFSQLWHCHLYPAARTHCCMLFLTTSPPLHHQQFYQSYFQNISRIRSVFTIYVIITLI